MKAPVLKIVTRLQGNNVFVRLEQLRTFDKLQLLRELRRRLDKGNSATITSRILFLIGHFGVMDDAETVRKYIEDGDDSVANAAYDALLRLTDPLRLAEDW